MGVMDILNPIGAIADIGTGLLNTYNQSENLKYQKSMQQQAWAREDNATQRRVEDLKAAGLSPTLAAGSAAQASSPIATTPSQFHQDSSYQDKAINYLSMAKMKNDVSTSEAQKKIAQAQSAVAQHDAKIDLGVQGIKSSQDKGVYGLIKSLNAGISGTPVGNAIQNVFNKAFSFTGSVPSDNSKPAVSAKTTTDDKNKGIAKDASVQKLNLPSNFWKKDISTTSLGDAYRRSEQEAFNNEIKRMFSK